MNSLNALGFLILGSVMNAVPALMPALVGDGPQIGDFSGRAIWLHFMGMVIGIIGASALIRESVVTYRIAKAAIARATPAPSAQPAPAGEPVQGSLQVAA